MQNIKKKSVIILLFLLFISMWSAALDGAARTVLLLPLQNKEEPKEEKSVFFEKEEFDDDNQINTLVTAIKNSFPDLEMPEGDAPLRKLLYLLKKPDFYETWLPYSAGIVPDSRVNEYLKQTATYRHKKAGRLTGKEKDNIALLNRLLIESSFPAICPKLGESFFKISYDYMQEVLEDKIRSKFAGNPAFHFAPVSQINDQLKSGTFRSADIYERQTSLLLAARLHADVVIYGKYHILEDKQYITCSVYDIITDEEFTLSFEENRLSFFYSMLEVFLSELTLKIEESILPLTKEQTIINLFNLHYSGLALSQEYEAVMKILDNQYYQKVIYKENNIVLIKGPLNDSFKTNYILLGFDEQRKLSNIWLLPEEVNQDDTIKVRRKVVDRINRIFGKKMTKISDNHFRWNGENTSFELITKLLHKNKTSLFYHLYTKGKIMEYPEIKYMVSDFKKGYDISAGGGTSFTTDIRWNAYRVERVFNNKKSELSSVTTGGPSTLAYKMGLVGNFSFCYYIDNDYAIGVGAKAGYYPSIVQYEISSSALLYMHTFSVSLLLRHKFMTIRDKQLRIILECGPGYDLELVPVRHYEVSSVNPDGTKSNFVRDLQDEHQGQFGQLFMAGTFLLSGGLEQKIKDNMTLEHLFFLGVRLGAESFSSYTIEPFYIGTEKYGEKYSVGGYLTSILIGYELRLNYYRFKKLK